MLFPCSLYGWRLKRGIGIFCVHYAVPVHNMRKYITILQEKALQDPVKYTNECQFITKYFHLIPYNTYADESTVPIEDLEAGGTDFLRNKSELPEWMS